MYIRDDEGRFVLAKTEWLTQLLDVDFGEALGLLSTLQWMCDLHLGNVDFQLDFKTVVDSLYGGKSAISNYSTMLNDSKRMLASDLATSDVMFIRRQAN